MTASSPLRFSALPRAPHGRWATRAGRSPGSRLERSSPPSRVQHPLGLWPSEHLEQWHWGRCSPLTVAGAAAGLARYRPARAVQANRTAFPFHPSVLAHVTEPSRFWTEPDGCRHVNTRRADCCYAASGVAGRVLSAMKIRRRTANALTVRNLADTVLERIGVSSSSAPCSYRDAPNSPRRKGKPMRR